LSVISDITGKLGIAGELLGFLWQQKLWWMIPMVAVLLVFGIVIVVGSSTGVGPFVYTLF
jgi:presenilin-like A22 family membrane protease